MSMIMMMSIIMMMMDTFEIGFHCMYCVLSVKVPFNTMNVRFYDVHVQTYECKCAIYISN